MASTPEEQTPGEEALLRSSAPFTAPITPEVLNELAVMARETRSASSPVKFRRRISRGAAVGLATVVIGGVGAAAALSGHVWSEPPGPPEWAAAPDAEVTFENPSGETCSSLIGNFQSNDPALNAAIEDYLASVNLMELIDVEAAIERMRTEEVTAVDERGQDVPGHYGTKYYPDPDTEYQTAVHQEMDRLLYEELARLGYTEDELAAADLQSNGYGSCETPQ